MNPDTERQGVELAYGMRRGIPAARMEQIHAGLPRSLDLRHLNPCLLNPLAAMDSEHKVRARIRLAQGWHLLNEARTALIEAESCKVFYTECEPNENRQAEIATPRRSIRPRHSSRMSLDGSTASARQAGMADAAMPSSAIVSTAPPTTTGSRGFARYTICPNNRLAKTPDSRPSTDPTASSTIGRPTAALLTCVWRAPNDTRMPNSFFRWLTL